MRRTIRRRIMMVAGATVLCAIAVASLVLGIVRLQAIERQTADLHSIQRQVALYISEMRHEAALLEFDFAAASSDRIWGLVEECNEALSHLIDIFGALIDGELALVQLREEWQEISAQDAREGWVHYSKDLWAMEKHFADVCQEIEEHLALNRQTALAFAFTGVGATALALFLCLWILAMIVSDVASDSYDSNALTHEVQSLSHNPHFASRVNLLLPGYDDNAETAGWEIEITRRFKEKHTHICFQAVASRGEDHVRLWGRRYKWAGYLKSFQRVFFPVFATANWRALNLMHNNGLDAPVPIVHHALRTGPFKTGSIILMEDVGDIESVMMYVNSRFCLLNQEDQDAFLQTLVKFLHSLHELGIYGIKPRYLHKDLSSAADRPRLYLLDLDKIVLWANCPTGIDRWLRKKDFKRLIRLLQPVLSRDRLHALSGIIKAIGNEHRNTSVPLARH